MSINPKKKREKAIKNAIKLGHKEFQKAKMNVEMEKQRIIEIHISAYRMAHTILVS